MSSQHDIYRRWLRLRNPVLRDIRTGMQFAAGASGSGDKQCVVTHVYIVYTRPPMYIRV